MSVLLEYGASVNVAAEDGETPLHLAAQQGMAAAIRFLCDHRADINAVSSEGETPLLAALQHVGNKSLVHISALLELRADPSIRDKGGHNAVQCALLYTNRGADLEPLLRQSSTARDASGEASELAPANITRALNVACQQGQTHCVKELLLHLPTMVQEQLIPAARGGHVEVMELLLSQRAHLLEKDRTEKTTPLISAADAGSVHMIRWLLKHQVDPNISSSDGASALMASSVKGSAEACSILIAARSDVNHSSDGGWTPLLVASQSGSVDAAKVLLDARADLNWRGADGTARELAVDNGKKDIVKLLDVRERLVARQKLRDREDAGKEAVDDQRDLDDLLLEIEGGGQKKATKKGTKSQSLSKPHGDVETDTPPAKQAVRSNPRSKKKKAAPTHAELGVSASPATVSEGTSLVGVATAPETHASAAPLIVDAKSLETEVLESKIVQVQPRAPQLPEPSRPKQATTVAADPEVVTLRTRLAAIDSQRKALDVEELQIRRRLDELAGYG
uniref:Uncharacterized protein n=1 Tax=Noctiluca scintillans TaxID=2966 RepID=A0A7S1AH85_NOCSC